MFQNHIIVALLSVLIIFISAYFINHDKNKIAGLVTAIPISLISLFFIEEKDKPDVVNSFMKGMLIYGMCVSFLYLLITYEAATINNSILICIGLWFGIASLYATRQQ